MATEPDREMRRRALGDLREYIRIAEEIGALEVVRGADPDLELGALYELSLEHDYPPLLLFEDIKGCDPRFRVVTNVRSSRVMVGSLGMDSVIALRKGNRREKKSIPPKFVNSGPVFENVLKGDDVDVLAFPAPRWHENDGGAYIGTECIVITKDPDSDWVNVGTYRVQVQDEKTVSVFIEPGKHGDMIRRKYWARGQHCPMVVCLGQAPVLGAAGRVVTPQGVSDFALAGGRIDEAIELVNGPITGIPMPAAAELVFEGHMPPPEEETRPEGPFGEWPGYYASETRDEPVLRVEAIYHRDDPIVVGNPPEKPTYPGRQTNFGNAAALWDALEAAGVPEVKGVWKVFGGGNRFINVIAIDQQFAGHAKMAGLVAAGCPAGAYMNRMTIIVDDDIDITSTAEVMWALATRWDPATQTDIVDGGWTGHIDPVLSPEKRESGDITSSRIIITAVRPFHWRDRFPKVNALDPAYAEEVRRKWAGKLAFLKA
ncbi:MAG TPA: UbiD family decarboxylase, partial [Alphaproteobacteria bacterium]